MDEVHVKLLKLPNIGLEFEEDDQTSHGKRSESRLCDFLYFLIDSD